MTPGDVRWLVMTHLHTDHAGGLHHFPKSEILVSRTEYGAARGLRGKLRGYLPHRWPEWFAPRLVDFDNEPLGPFPRSLRLTRAGDVHLVPTPGHTAGHMSVIVNDGDRVLFLAGDTSYSEENLRRGIVDGVSSLGGGEDAAARTLARIRALAEDVPLVYLPSHEPGAADRLTFKASLAISRRTSVA
jgi:N-acyl homoserine lactone hydrolase